MLECMWSIGFGMSSCRALAFEGGAFEASGPSGLPGATSLAKQTVVKCKHYRYPN